MMVLERCDATYVRRWKKADVFGKTDGEQLPQVEGGLIACCSDCDCFPDMYQHQVRLQKPHRHKPRPHMFVLHGGPLRLAKNSPLNVETPLQDEYLIHDLREALDGKGITNVQLLAHFPCMRVSKYAHLVAPTREELFPYTVGLLVGVKRRLREIFPDIRFPCFFHVNYGRKMHTHFVNPDLWDIWVEEHMPLMPQISLSIQFSQAA